MKNGVLNFISSQPLSNSSKNCDGVNFIKGAKPVLVCRWEPCSSVRVQYTVYVISKHMCVDIKFHQVGDNIRPTFKSNFHIYKNSRATMICILQTVCPTTTFNFKKLSLGHNYVFYIANCLHELGTAARRNFPFSTFNFKKTITKYLDRNK